MSKLIERLQENKILISDGAWGTLLQEQGLQPGDCPELWNLTNANNVRAVARAYIEAGSELILTNTFGGSSFKLASYGLQDKTREINRVGTALSKEEAGEKAFVAASVGPTGKFLQPLGEVSEQEMYEVFCEQISAQAEGGADAILIETMSDLTEASLAVRAAHMTTNLPVLVTMTFEKGKQGYRTMMGVSIEQAVTTLTKAGADVLGTNCGNGIEQICEIIAEMRGYTTKYLIAHPNAGLPRLVNNKTVFDQSPQKMAQYVPQLISAGANIIGGCCGTTPEHIRAIVTRIKKYN